MDSKPMLICRCEEISLDEILNAVANGARSVAEVKKRTRAGMGLCQGRTCERLVQQILKRELGAEACHHPDTSRPPVRPLAFGTLGGGSSEEL
jgi:NAD(P)H-nitrite reductase large subunit